MPPHGGLPRSLGDLAPGTNTGATHLRAHLRADPCAAGDFAPSSPTGTLLGGGIA